MQVAECLPYAWTEKLKHYVFVLFIQYFPVKPAIQFNDTKQMEFAANE